MIRTITAWQEACTLIPKVLVACGLTNGIELSQEQRTANTGVMFWELRVPDLELSKKPTYITWKADRNQTTEYSDGLPMARVASGIIDIYSNSSRMDTTMANLLNLIDLKFTESEWDASLITYEYDDRQNRFHYQFEVITIMRG